MEKENFNKAAWIDFAICLLFGWLGVHKFREKKAGLGVLYLFTFGIFGIGWLIDIITHLDSAIKGKQIPNKEAGQIKQKPKTYTSTNTGFSYTPTKKVGEYFVVNETEKTWAVPTGLFKKTVQPTSVHKYSEIVSFELLEDGNSITKGGIGRAVAGGVLFGGVGAIVGGSTGKKKTKGVCTKLQVKITLNNMSTPTVYVNLIETSTKKDSFIYTTAYSSAQEILSILQIICSQKDNTTEDKSENKSSSVISATDEIKKYKELLDMGAITTEEFETKKKELLNL